MTKILDINRKAGVGKDWENAEKDDFFPTPPEAIIPLLEHEKFIGKIWEPACGDGAISRVLIDHGYDVDSSDLVDRGYGTPRQDFLMEYQARAPNVVTNPPFKLAEEFIHKALALTTGKVAMYLPLTYLAGINRTRDIWRALPIARIYILDWRVSMLRGGVDGGKGGGGMMWFMWVVFEHGHVGPPQMIWLSKPLT